MIVIQGCRTKKINNKTLHREIKNSGCKTHDGGNTVATANDFELKPNKVKNCIRRLQTFDSFKTLLHITSSAKTSRQSTSNFTLRNKRRTKKLPYVAQNGLTSYIISRRRWRHLAGDSRNCDVSNYKTHLIQLRQNQGTLNQKKLITAQNSQHASGRNLSSDRP